ncbi:unnamed protein product [Blepharisma stoltei]|uniref:RGS domain-containing protein n=1 Tax=Blepharisma stoltei TaxID=1481888 RepID=A0AAU9IJ40_9CILI|nr:unnamed protein product [Blepharisma stoltei]
MNSDVFIWISWPVVMLLLSLAYYKYIKFLKSINDYSLHSRCRQIVFSATISNCIEANSLLSLGFLTILRLEETYRYALFFYVVSIYSHHWHFCSNILKIYRLNLLTKLKLGQYSSLEKFQRREKRVEWSWNIRVIVIYTMASALPSLYFLIDAVLEKTPERVYGLTNDMYIFVWTLWDIFELVLICIFLIKLYKNQVNNKLKLELCLMGIIWSMSLTSACFTADNVYYYLLIVLPLRNILIIISAFIISWRDLNEIEAPLPIDIDSKMIFEHRRIYEQFMKFNKKNNAIHENYINLIVKIEKFEIDPTIKNADEIMDGFLKEKRISIPDSMCSKLSSDLRYYMKHGDLERYFFTELKKYIYFYYIDPAFEKFKESKYFVRI